MWEITWNVKFRSVSPICAWIFSFPELQLSFSKYKPLYMKSNSNSALICLKWYSKQIVHVYQIISQVNLHNLKIKSWKESLSTFNFGTYTYDHYTGWSIIEDTKIVVNISGQEASYVLRNFTEIQFPLNNLANLFLIVMDPLFSEIVKEELF